MNHAFIFLIAKRYAFEYFKKKIVRMVMHSSKNSFIVSHTFVNFQIPGNLRYAYKLCITNFKC